MFWGTRCRVHCQRSRVLSNGALQLMRWVLAGAPCAMSTGALGSPDCRLPLATASPTMPYCIDA